MLIISLVSLVVARLSSYRAPFERIPKDPNGVSFDNSDRLLDRFSDTNLLEFVNNKVKADNSRSMDICIRALPRYVSRLFVTQPTLLQSKR